MQQSTVYCLWSHPTWRNLWPCQPQNRSLDYPTKTQSGLSAGLYLFVFLVGAWGVTEVLSSDVFHLPRSSKEQAEVFWKGWPFFFTLHKFLSLKFGHRGRRCIVQWCDTALTQHSVRVGMKCGRVVGVERGAGRARRFLKPLCRTGSCPISSACTALVPLSCLHRPTRLDPHRAVLWCGSPCSAASPLVGRRSYAADSPEQLRPCPPPHGRSRCQSVVWKNPPGDHTMWTVSLRSWQNTTRNLNYLGCCAKCNIKQSVSDTNKQLKKQLAAN